MKKEIAVSLSIPLLLSALLATAQLASAATDTWTGNTDANWNSAGNWTGANPPNAGDSLIFGTSAQTILNNNVTAGTAFSGLTFNGSSAFTLNGNGILLSGQAAGSTLGLANSSGQAQTIGSMALNLDWGYYTFSSSSGTLALNSAITPNTGGVAYFGAANLTSTLPTDSAGLISGLGGAGLMYDGVLTPTSLATIDGSGNIVAYPSGSYVSYAAGAALSSGVNDNVLLTATGTAAYSAADGTTVNTITSASVGNAGGTAKTTLTTTGTLILGANGGVYLLGNTLGNKACLSLAGGAITAGSSGPGTILFAVNGNNPNNQLSVSSAIKDNAGGGPVTVVVTGPGSMNFATTTATSYSGGTYVNQGQLQWGQVTGVGTGPIHVAANASVYYTSSTTFTNDFYLSPGPGAASGATSANAALVVGASAPTLSGTIHLLGPAAPTGPGVRFSSTYSGGTGTNTFTGQITGSGTLDLYMGAHSGNVILSNITANPNDWQGGLIIDPASTLSCYFKQGANNQIPNGPGTGDILLVSGGGDARFDLNGYNATINALNGSSSGTVAKQELGNYGTANATLTMGANNHDGAFYGVTQDAGTRTLGLVKTGSGTQTFNGAATFPYRGNTTVSQGTFALAGAGQIPNSPVITVASGATLDGSGLTAGGLSIGAAQTLAGLGTVNGSTVINGTVNPFLNTIGTLANNGSVTLNSGGTYVWDINGAAGTAGADPGWSQINITGGLTITATSGSPFTINLTSLTAGDGAGSVPDFDNTANYAWSIVKTTGGITGFDPSAFVLNTAGFANALGSGQFFITANGTDLILLFLQRPAVTSTVAGQGTFSGAPNLSYTVQYTADLTAPVNWQTLTTVTTDGSGNGSFIDASAPAGQSQRFYRVIYP